MNHQIDSRGILYVATGETYIRAAMQSANTAKKFCPDLRIHIFCDWQNYTLGFDVSTFPFSSVEKIHDPHRRSKVDYLAKTPFDQTLYLDTDTSIIADIGDMFRILERFDVALAQAHRRNTIERLQPLQLNLPQAFPQYNSGVFLYRKTPAVCQFLEEWSVYFKESGCQHDQPSLRELLWLSDLRIATLPPEYNVRHLKYHFLWSKSEASTKIFHLKQLHMGWFRWLNRKSRTTRIARKLGLGSVINMIKKIVTRNHR
jgi:hypothetical protein